MSDGPAAPYGPPAPAEEPRRRRIGWLPVVGLVLAAALLAAGVAVFVHSGAERDDAARELRQARAQRGAGRTVLHRAQQDLATAQAAVATFGASAQSATGAIGRVVEREGELIDLLARLRSAGQATQIDTYNSLVEQLNRASDDLVTAFNDLELPLQDFSDTLDLLPTARCTAPVSPELRWVKYGNDGLQCARLRVPLDDDNLSTGTIQITAVRHPAEDPNPLGPLVLNPGGPGVSGVSFMRDALVLLPPELLRRFDVITFDPRGVGRSTAVDCADDLDPLFDPDLTAPDPAVVDQAIAEVARIVRGCRARTGPLLQHVDTVSAAKDLERLRAALGVKQLSYIGFSYGTYLGAVYADLFPSRVRAAVLDGAVDPGRATDNRVGNDATSFGAALDAALNDCATRPSCPFFSGGDPQRAYYQLMTQLREGGLDAGGRVVKRVLAETGVISALYLGQAGWPRLMSALAAATTGDGRPLAELADSYTGRRRDGTYTNEIEAHYAINCIDIRGRLTPAEARARAHGNLPGRLEPVSLAFELPCAFWPAQAQSTPGPLDAAGAAPIVVIGGEADPATPIEGAEALATSLESGVLVKAGGSGHTSFARGNQCVDDLVVAYLVSLTVPADGTTCPAG